VSVWFTSDHHFGHAGILEWQAETRPFASVDEMDAELVRRWNARVAPGDMVYHVGDLFWGSADHALAILRRLNGQVYLIRGNHDRTADKPTVRKKLAALKDMASIRVNGQPIILCHYAMRVWNRSHYGAWQLYGHSHGSLPDDPNAMSMDVGVDCHGLAPVSFDEVASVMSRKAWKPVDHHTPTPKD